MDEAGFDNRDDYPYGYSPKGIVIDNASFHKGENIRKIVEEAGCELWYLPAYSPDFNKIERWWAVLKTWMKQRLSEFETVRECVDAAFKNCPNVLA